MNLSLRQLRAFLGVAESSSFTKTAQRLHLSQAALSAIVRELESQLQCRLLDRTTRTVALTEAGRVFVHTATHIVQVLENSALEVAKISREERRVLRIGVTPHIAVSLIPTILKRFAQNHPEVMVEVSDRPPEALLRSVESGTLDAAYGAFFGKTSGIERTPIFPTHLVLVSPAGKQSELERTATGGVTWKALHDAPLMCFHSENQIQRLVEENLARACISPGKRIVVSHLETAIAMAEAGFGLAIVPSLSEATCARFNVLIDKIEPLVELSFDCITQAGRGKMEILEQLSHVFEQVANHFGKAGASKSSRNKKTASAPG